MYWNVKVAVSYDTEKGPKQKKEQYLVEAESTTDAEAKIHTDFKDYGDDFEVISVSKSNVIKVIN